ncbi:hypothetical protein [Pseudooceanicola sp. HF7]|uniref:hypothetical protein n=1 Tax=Pseudooceanicola sp. HF7 TaxID=2721560 RepID=UPI001C37759D|nr:hypothetical protein [Pseudooceanicola sp. HF7]
MAVVLPLTLVTEVLKAVPAEAGLWRWVALVLASVCAAGITAYTAASTIKGDRVNSPASRFRQSAWLLISLFIGICVAALHHAASIPIAYGIVVPLVSAVSAVPFDPAMASPAQLVALAVLTLIPTVLLSLLVALVVGRLILVHAPNRGWAALLAGAGFILPVAIAMVTLPSNDRAEMLAAMGGTSLLFLSLSALPWAGLYSIAYLAGAASFGARKTVN